MKTEISFGYKESYLPTPRCRKLRYRGAQDKIEVEIEEVKSRKAPIVFIVKEYDRANEYRFYNNKLWVKMRWNEAHSGKDGLMPLNELHWYIYNQSYSWQDRESVIKNIKKSTERYLIIDSVVYKESGEPRYCINTFGLGHNHGGTGVFVDTFYNSNISKDRYFNANNRKDMLKKAKETALNRGDTESIQYLNNSKIVVIKPELVKCNPQVEHGDGDEFINQIESMVNLSSSSAEAGLFAMALALKSMR